MKAAESTSSSAVGRADKGTPENPAFSSASRTTCWFGSRGRRTEGLDLRGPSSTWTYLVNDEPFKNQIGMMLTGPGRTSVAIYSAAVLMPLLVLWGFVDRVRRKPGKGTNYRP
jgi:hypothetical protein